MRDVAVAWAGGAREQVHEVGERQDDGRPIGMRVRGVIRDDGDGAWADERRRVVEEERERLCAHLDARWG